MLTALKLASIPGSFGMSTVEMIVEIQTINLIGYTTHVAILRALT